MWSTCSCFPCYHLCRWCNFQDLMNTRFETSKMDWIRVITHHDMFASFLSWFDIVPLIVSPCLLCLLQCWSFFLSFSLNIRCSWRQTIDHSYCLQVLTNTEISEPHFFPSIQFMVTSTTVSLVTCKKEEKDHNELDTVAAYDIPFTHARISHVVKWSCKMWCQQWGVAGCQASSTAQAVTHH